MSKKNIYSYREEIQSALNGVPEGEKKEYFAKIMQFSKMNVNELLDLSESNGISASILKDVGIESTESAPDDSKSIEIEEYMQEVETSFNSRLNNIQISSIKYMKGNGGVECTKNKYTRLGKEDLPNLDLGNGTIFNGENGITIKFDLPGTTQEYVIIEFKSCTEDEVLYKHDLIVLKNLIQGKNIAGLIEEKSKKIKEKYSDGMTGLYNSTYFSEILSRPNHDYSGIFIDISLFKQINDENGQSFGDEAIKEVARFLEKSVRPNDKVVRVGGDEFFILFNNGKKSGEENKTNIESFIARLNENSSDLSLYNQDLGKNVNIGLKYGYAISEESDSKNSTELIKIANDMLNDEKNPEGKAYRILSMFKELKDDAIIPTIKFLISNQLFTEKFFPALFESEDEGDYFFHVFHSIIYDKVSEIGKLNILPEEMSHMREYLEYIQLFRTKSDEELKTFFSE